MQLGHPLRSVAREIVGEPNGQRVESGQGQHAVQGLLREEVGGETSGASGFMIFTRPRFSPRARPEAPSSTARARRRKRPTRLRPMRSRRSHGWNGPPTRIATLGPPATSSDDQACVQLRTFGRARTSSRLPITRGRMPHRSRAHRREDGHRPRRPSSASSR